MHISTVYCEINFHPLVNESMHDEINSDTMEPRCNEPLYNEVLCIKNDFLYPSDSKVYEK